MHDTLMPLVWCALIAAEAASSKARKKNDEKKEKEWVVGQRCVHNVCQCVYGRKWKSSAVFRGWERNRPWRPVVVELWTLGGPTGGGAGLKDSTRRHDPLTLTNDRPTSSRLSRWLRNILTGGERSYSFFLFLKNRVTESLASSKNNSTRRL